MEQSYKDEKKRIEKTEKEKDHLGARLQRLQQEYDEQVLTTTRLLSENQQQTAELKSWEEEVSKLKEDARSLTRVRDSLSKKIKSLEDSKLEAEVERDQLRAVNHGLSYDLDNVKKELDALHKSVENVSRERDIAQKNFVRATGATQKQYNVVKLAEQTKRNLEQEIMGYKDEAGKMRKVGVSLEDSFFTSRRSIRTVTLTFTCQTANLVPRKRPRPSHQRSLQNSPNPQHQRGRNQNERDDAL